MTTEIDRDDEDWLQALAGEPRQGADSFTNSQATAVRNALSRRAKVLEKDVAEPSEAGYHRLLFRLKREGYIGPDADKKHLSNLPANDEFSDYANTGTYGTYDLPPAMRSARQRSPEDHQGKSTQVLPKKTWWNPALGMAAVFVLGAALIFYMQVGGHKEEDPFAMRSGKAVVLIVQDQNEKVMQLVDTLNPLGGNVKISREADGSVSLLIKATDEVLLELAGQQIQPEVKDGYIKISVERKSQQ